MRRAQDAVLKTRPFSETLQKVLGGLIQRLKKDNFDSPLMTERPVKKVRSLSFSTYQLYMCVQDEDRMTAGGQDFWCGGTVLGEHTK